MTRLSIAAAAALFALTAATAAQAQSGFYVTGSAGLAMARDAGIKNVSEGTNALLNAGSTLNDLDRSPVFGLGLGYRVSPLLRADLSLSQRSGLDLSDGEGTPTIGSGRTDLTAKIRSRAVFLTGYVDAGSFLPPQYAWINPYVGAGVGYAVNRMSGLTVTNDTTGNTTDLGRDTTTSAPSGTGRGLAWQIAAGLGFEITRSLTLDVGYRYVDLGAIKVDQGRYVFPSTPTNADTNALKGDLRTHELTVGVRYSF
jgi:opacity protein-like surface antigen